MIQAWLHPSTGGVLILSLGLLGGVFHIFNVSQDNHDQIELNHSKIADDFKEKHLQQEQVSFYDTFRQQRPKEARLFRKKDIILSASSNQILTHFLDGVRKKSRFQKLTQTLGKEENASLGLTRIPITLTGTNTNDSEWFRLFQSIQSDLPGHIVIRTFQLKKVGAFIQATITADWFFQKPL